MSTNPLVTSISSPQYYYEVHSTERFNALCRILDAYTQATTIIFCRTKKDVDHISEKLTILKYSVSSYHGDLSPTAREKALNQFINKETKILILTDIPAQINDFPNIDLVLFSIIPQDPDSYIQRIIRLESIIKVNEVATLISTNEFKKIAFIKRVTKSDIVKKDFLNAKDIISVKQKTFIDDLNAFDFKSIFPEVDTFTKDLLEKFTPEQLVSYCLQQGVKNDFSLETFLPLKVSDSNANKKNKTDKDDTNELSSGFERLFIAIGKTDGVNDEKLKKFLFEETSIEVDAFSEVKIFETFSFFVVSNENADIILEIFRRKKRGKRSIVERAKGKDSKKKN